MGFQILLFFALIGALPQARAETEFEVLFVPGMTSDGTYRLGPLLIDTNRVPSSFQNYIKHLDSVGIKNRFIKTDSEGDVPTNAYKIAKQIKGNELPVILIGHSRGSVDSLEALIKYPEIRDRVLGFVAIQSPFWGTEISDWIESTYSLKNFIAYLSYFVSGDKNLSAQLTRKTRAEYMLKHSREVQSITSQIPVLTVTTNAGDVVSDKLALTRLFSDSSDGVVPTDSGYLPGARNLHLSGLDHLSVVIETAHSTLNHTEFLKGAMDFIFQKRFLFIKNKTEAEPVANL